MPDTEQVLDEAFQLIEAEQYARARELVQPLLESEPDNPDVWWVYAHAVEDADAGQSALDRVQALQPDYAGLQAVREALPAPAPARPLQKLSSKPQTEPTASPEAPADSSETTPQPESASEEASSSGRGGIARLLLVAVLILVIVAGVLFVLSNQTTTAPPATPTTVAADSTEPSDTAVAQAGEETDEPTQEPTITETDEPTATVVEATSIAVVEETDEPTQEPSITDEPTATRTDEPTEEPTATEATEQPTDEPTAAEQPTDEPTATEQPTEVATQQPTATEATEQPMDEPTATEQPTDEPTATEQPTEVATDGADATATQAAADVEADADYELLVSALGDFDLPENPVDTETTTLGNTLLVTACGVAGPAINNTVRNVLNIVTEELDSISNDVMAVGVRVINCDAETAISTIAVTRADAQAFADGELDDREFLRAWRRV